MIDLIDCGYLVDCLWLLGGQRCVSFFSCCRSWAKKSAMFWALAVCMLLMTVSGLFIWRAWFGFDITLVRMGAVVRRKLLETTDLHRPHAAAN